MDHSHLQVQTNCPPSSNPTCFISGTARTKGVADQEYFAGNQRNADSRSVNRNRQKDETFPIQQKYMANSLSNTLKSFDRYFDELLAMIPRRVLHWSVEDVGKWLSLIGLGVNFQKFAQLSIDGSSIILLTQQDLIKQIGIRSSMTIGILMGWVTEGFEKYDWLLQSTGVVIDNIEITMEMRNRINQISFIENKSSVCGSKDQNRQSFLKNNRTSSFEFQENRTNMNQLSFVSPMGKQRGGRLLSSKKKVELKRLQILDKLTNICMSVNKFPFDLIKQLDKANKDHKTYYNQEKASFAFQGRGRRKTLIKSLREQLIGKNSQMQNWEQPQFYSQVNHWNAIPQELAKIQISIEKDDKSGFSLQMVVDSASGASDIERKVFSQGQESSLYDRINRLNRFYDEEVQKQEGYGLYCGDNRQTIGIHEKQTDGSEQQMLSCPTGIRRRRRDCSSHIKPQANSHLKMSSTRKQSKCDLQWESSKHRELAYNSWDVHAYIMLKEAMEILKLPSTDPLYFTFQFVIDEFEFHGEFQQVNSFTLIANNGKDRGITKLQIIASHQDWKSVFMICMDPFARKPILKQLPPQQPYSTWDENCRYAKMLSIVYIREEEKFYLCKPGQLKHFLQVKHPILVTHDENDKSEKSHGGLYSQAQSTPEQNQKYISNRMQYNMNGDSTKKKPNDHPSFEFRVWIKLPVQDPSSISLPPIINIRNGSAIKIGDRQIVFTIHTAQIQATKVKESRYGSYQEDSSCLNGNSQIEQDQDASDDLESVESHFNKCIICYEKPNNCVYLQCMHNVTCLSCGKVLENCPVCRQPIVDYLRLYTN